MTIFLILAAVLGASALLIGSLGAHLWQDLLTDPDTAGRFQRAENYLFYHALGLAVVAQLVERFPAQKFQSGPIRINSANLNIYPSRRQDDLSQLIFGQINKQL